MNSVHHRPHNRTTGQGRTQRTRLHLEPIWWLLFSAGGVCVAVFIPAVALIFGLLWPLGVVEIELTQLASWYQSPWGLAFTAVAMVLPAFHAAHRVRHGLYDLKLSQGRGYASYLCYGSAAVVSGLAVFAWLLA